jgi:hypothetical protein
MEVPAVKKLSIAALAVALTALSATPANAGVLVQDAPSCADQPTSQPFAPWGDNSDYTLIPGGDFESDARGWKLSRAGVVAGNESFYVGGSRDSRSLKISAGGTATSPTVCVGLEHPSMRFFARSSGGLLGLRAMDVEVIFESSLGARLSAPIGAVLPSNSWKPSARMVVVANLLPLLPGNYTPVAFRFRPLVGTWYIDDVYLDPRRH